MQPEPQRTLSEGQLAACGNIGKRVAHGSCRGDARGRRRGLGSSDVGEEERDDAISGVPTDNAARIDDASVRGAYEAPNEREVLRSRRRRASGEDASRSATKIAAGRRSAC
jgi:hypothetical protein